MISPRLAAPEAGSWELEPHIPQLEIKGQYELKMLLCLFQDWPSHM